MLKQSEEVTLRPTTSGRGVISGLTYEHIPVGVVFCDSKGRIIRMNTRNCEIFGITDRKLVYGFNIFDDEDILAVHREKMKLCDDYSYSYELNTDHLTSRGRSTFSGKRELFCRFRRVYDVNRNHLGYVLVNVDMTATQHELRSEATNLSMQLQKILSSANMMSWRYDVRTGKILANYTNAPSEFLTRSSIIKELNITDFVRFIHPDDQHIFLEQFASVMQRHSDELSFEIRYRFDHDGDYLWASMSGIVSELDGNGKVLLIVGATNVIERQKRMEEELREAKERAEASDKLKTAFIEHTNHEIRTPLNAIVGYADILASCYSSLNEDSLQELALGIRQNTEKMLTMFSNILFLSQLSSGTLSKNVKECCVHDVCKAICLKYKKLTNDSVELVFNSEAGPDVSLSTDVRLLNIVLCNLLENALKFTTQGQVSLGYTPYEGGVEFSVSDTGPGLSALDQKFELFTKGDRFTPGLGLGLPLSRGLVDFLGGEMSIQTNMGKGTTFCIKIPNDVIS